MMQMELCQIMLFKNLTQYLNQCPVKLLPSKVHCINLLPSPTSSAKYFPFSVSSTQFHKVKSCSVHAGWCFEIGSSVTSVSLAACESSLAHLLAIIQLMYISLNMHLYTNVYNINCIKYTIYICLYIKVSEIILLWENANSFSNGKSDRKQMFHTESCNIYFSLETSKQHLKSESNYVSYPDVIFQPLWGFENFF